jgi:hypothetical protein
VKVTLLLADAAQVAADKLSILGGGWSWIGPGPATFSVAGLIEVPWDQANRPHTWTLRLQDADGAVVRLPGDKPVIVEGRIEVGRPVGSVEGVPLTVPLAVNFVGLPLPAGRRYVFEFGINGESRDEWRVGFNTRPAN